MQASDYWRTKTSDYQNFTGADGASVQNSLLELTRNISRLTTTAAQLQSSDTTLFSSIASVTASLATLTSSINTQFSSVNNQLSSVNNQLSKLYPTATDTGSNSTMLTANQVLGGIIVANPNVSTVILTLPMASQLVNVDNGAQVGKGYTFTIINSSTAYSVIVSAGSIDNSPGLNIIGNPIVSINRSANFYVSYDNITPTQEAVVIYRR